MRTTNHVRAGQGGMIDPAERTTPENTMSTTTRVRAGQGGTIDPDG